MKHDIGYVIDLETASTAVDAVILSMGVVEIDMRALVLTGAELYVPIDGAKQVGRRADKDTMWWWTQQSNEARKAAFEDPSAVTLDVALDQLATFLGYEGNPVSHCSVWGNGPEFDIAILNHAAAQFGVRPPWAHNVARCVRTVLDVANVDKEPSLPDEIAHHALHDARWEARHIIRALKSLRQGAGA